MKNLSNSRSRILKNFASAFGREVADADDPFRLENANDFAEVHVARREQFFALSRRKFVRRPISSGLLNKRERTIIHDDVLAEKFLRIAELLCE